jgi:RNA-directed DNA polymerase
VPDKVASQNGNVKLVHSLQRLLVKSYYGRLLATRKVTQDNQGKKTAGVDGVKSLTPKQRLEITSQIKLRGKCKPTCRVN